VLTPAQNTLLIPLSPGKFTFYCEYWYLLRIVNYGGLHGKQIP
jgi:hypothetical protein